MALEPTGVRLVAENSSGFASALAGAGRAVTGFVGLVAGAAVGIGAGLAAGLGTAAAAGLGFNNQLEQASARIQAFTKDSEATAAVLDMVRERAANTPFAFNEMADAAAALGPVAKSSGRDLEGLIATAEILAASNPAEGLAGAAFALREAASGDFTSIIERFNLSRQYLNQLKAEGVPAIEAVGMALEQAGYDASLVTNLANTASGRLSTLADTFTNLAGTATKPIFDAFSSGLGEVNKILSDNAPLLNQAAEGIGQILAPAAEMLGGIMRAAAEGLVSFAKNLPAIASQVGQVAGVFMAVIDAAKKWWAALSPLLGQAFQWGSNLIGQLAKGMLQAASVVVSVLAQIGGIITSWLAPGSPPKLLPDLPEWGQSAVNEFMKGWASPDLSSFSELAGTIEGMLRDLVDTGQTDEGGVLTLIFGSRDAIAKAVEEFRTLGSVSEESFSAIREAAGPAGDSAERFARAYFEVQEASRDVAEAQEDVESATRAVDDAQKALNDTLAAYEAILAPLNAELQGIQDRKQEIKDAQRIAELQEELASGKLDEQEAELARLEIAEIQKEQQIRATEREMEAAEEAAQANVTAAEEGQAAAEARLTAAQEAEAAAQAQLEREQAAISLQGDQNRLIAEQISLLEKLAKAAEKGAAGGGAGGIGGIALPEMPAPGEGPLGDVTSQLEEINKVFEGFQQGIEDVQSGPLVQQINNIAAAVAGIPGSFAGAQTAVNGFFNTPLGTEIQQGAQVVASYFANDFQTDLNNGIALAEAGLNRIADSDFGQRLQRGAQVVASYMVNEFPADFQAGFQLVVDYLKPVGEAFDKDMARNKEIAQGIATYILDEWPADFQAGFDLVVDFASKLPERVQQGFDDLKQGIMDLPTTLTTEAEKVGTAIAQGIADGISGAAGRAIEAAKRLASGLPDWVKKVLGIASPSKVMAALGLNAGDSFAGGILKAIPAALQAAQALAEDVRDKVMKELERVAADVQKFMQERLSGRIGLARGGISSIGLLSDAQLAIKDAQKEQGDIAAELEELRTAGAQRELDIAKEVHALEEERRAAMLTAEQNLDPEARADAAARLLEIDEEIAGILAEADAERIADLARQQELLQENEAAAQRYNAAVERENYLRGEIAKVQAQAAEIAKTDPLAAQQFLNLRLSQLEEMADLQEALATAEGAGTKELIQQQIDLLKAAQALELEQFQREQAERAAEISQLGQPGEVGEAAGDEFLAAFGKSLGAGAPQLAAGLIGALQLALAPAVASLLGPEGSATYSAIAPVLYEGGSGGSTYGDQTVNINGAGYSLSQLKAVVREVLAEQSRAANTTARAV